MSGQPKARLLTLGSLDQRTVAAKQARETISAIESDLGGAENIATAKRQIIESAAVTSAMVADFGSRWLAGEQIDLRYSRRSVIRSAAYLSRLALSFGQKTYLPICEKSIGEMATEKTSHTRNEDPHWPIPF